MIVEDSNSGYEFFLGLSEGKKWTVVSAKGKSNIFKLLKDCHGKDRILAVADGAAFGAEMNRIMSLVNENEQIQLFLPESFEWLVLMSDILQDKEVNKMLENPSAYIESSQYMSWEQYFTATLVEKTRVIYTNQYKIIYRKIRECMVKFIYNLPM